MVPSHSTGTLLRHSFALNQLHQKRKGAAATSGPFPFYISSYPRACILRDRASSRITDTAKITSSNGRISVTAGITALAPVHNARYAARHIGHFGSSTSNTPEPMLPLALPSRLPRRRCFISASQHSIALSSMRAARSRGLLSLITIVMFYPGHRPRQALFIAAFRRHIEHGVNTQQTFQPSCIR